MSHEQYSFSNYLRCSCVYVVFVYGFPYMFVVMDSLLIECNNVAH